MNTQQVAVINTVHQAQVAPVSLNLHSRFSPARGALEQAIAQVFARTYGAELTHFLPLLLELQVNAESAAVVGLMPGSCGPMFLEQYLERPIEQRAAEVLQRPVSRHSVVEIGNLAADRKGFSQLLFVAMTVALAEAKYQWLAFTATDQVNKLIARLGCEAHTLAHADVAKLGSDASRWGSYYDNAPKVMLLDIQAALVSARQQPRIGALIDECQPLAAGIARKLRDHRRLCLLRAEELCA